MPDKTAMGTQKSRWERPALLCVHRFHSGLQPPDTSWCSSSLRPLQEKELLHHMPFASDHSWTCRKINQREFEKCCVRALTHFWVESAGMPQLLESGKAPAESTMVTYRITHYGNLSLGILPSTQYCCQGK